MGKTFGLLSLILGLIALAVGWLIMMMVPLYGSYIMYAICGLGIVFAIIGFIKDDGKALAIVGLILNIIALILWPVLWAIVFIAIFAGLGLF